LPAENARPAPSTHGKGPLVAGSETGRVSEPEAGPSSGIWLEVTAAATSTAGVAAVAVPVKAPAVKKRSLLQAVMDELSDSD
jgi:hypothetical protein